MLVQQRRYGDAVPYCIYADDYKTISRIVDILLDEYIEKGLHLSLLFPLSLMSI